VKHKFSKRNTDVREEDKIRLQVNRDGTLEIMFNPSGQFVKNSCAVKKSRGYSVGTWEDYLTNPVD